MPVYLFLTSILHLELLAMLSVASETTYSRLADLDRRHVLHPLRDSGDGDPLIIVRGSGSRLWTADGRELLDGTAGGLWLSLVGHGRAELGEVAARQMGELEYFTSFWNYSNDRSIELATRIAELAPDGLTRVFFCCSGSEADDTAIKLARSFHYRRGEPNRNWIISRRGGYHGVTYGGGSATGLDEFREGFGPMLPNVEHVTPPWPYQRSLYNGEDPTDFLLDELERTIERIGAENIAAMMGEPVLGVGGVLIPPADYWPRVRALLRAHGILLIADEVVTGFGRSGHWFASGPMGMDPDIVTFAKGVSSGYVPLGGVIMREEIADAVSGGEGGFHHGFTYVGHPVSCAVATANIDILEREELPAASTRIGELFAAELAPLLDAPHVGEIRTYGSMIAIEMVGDKQGREPLLITGVADALQSTHGVIGREIGSVVALSPPLVMTPDEVRTVAAAVREVVPRIGADGRVE
jgi:PLP-dependent transaminase